MLRLHTVALAAMLALAAVAVRPEMLPPNTVSTSVSYHLPVSYTEATPEGRTANRALPDNYFESVDVTIKNHLQVDIQVTGAQVVFVEPNGTPVPTVAMVRFGAPRPPIAFTLPANGEKTVTITPLDFNYRLTPGQCYVGRITWQLTIGGGETGVYTQVFPYLTPDPTPTFASEWAKQDGVSARLVLQQTEQKALQVFAEFRNDANQELTLSVSPFMENTLQRHLLDDAWVPVGGSIKAMYIPSDIKVTLPPNGTVTIGVDIQSSYGELNIIPRSYRELTPGEYALTVTLDARSPKDALYRWTLPVTFAVPLANPVPVVDPLTILAMD